MRQTNPRLKPTYFAGAYGRLMPTLGGLGKLGILEENKSWLGWFRNAQCPACYPACDDALQHLVLSDAGLRGDAFPGCADARSEIRM